MAAPLSYHKAMVTPLYLDGNLATGHGLHGSTRSTGLGLQCAHVLGGVALPLHRLQRLLGAAAAAAPPQAGKLSQPKYNLTNLLALLIMLAHNYQNHK